MAPVVHVTTLTTVYETKQLPAGCSGTHRLRVSAVGETRIRSCVSPCGPCKSVRFELLLEELLALDLVVLAAHFAGQYQARPPVLSPVTGFFPPHGGIVLVPALAFPGYL